MVYFVPYTAKAEAFYVVRQGIARTNRLVDAAPLPEAGRHARPLGF